MRGRGGDLFQHVVTPDELAKRGVLPVKKARVAVADEELAAGGIRILRASHREDAADMGFVVELGLDLVAGAASTPGLLLAGVLGQRIATLDHEALDNAVETSAVVKALERQLLEILDVAGRDVWPEFKDHFAGTGGKNGNFTHKLFGLELFGLVGGNDGRGFDVIEVRKILFQVGVAFTLNAALIRPATTGSAFAILAVDLVHHIHSLNHFPER
jgi:hypothetical protein